MADVTGPISSMPGSYHAVPENMMCDDHPDRPATHRVQGETDSMGCEMNDMCDECYQQHLAYMREHAAAERCGICEWCKNTVTDLRDRRDYDEGMSGRIYRVCGACARRDEERYAVELDEYDFIDDDYDDYSADDMEDIFDAD